MKKLIVNILIFIILISISSAAFAASGDATGLPPSITVSGIPGNLVCNDSQGSLYTKGGDYDELNAKEDYGPTTEEDYNIVFGYKRSKAKYDTSGRDVTSQKDDAFWYIAANTKGADRQAAYWKSNNQAVPVKWVGEAAAGGAAGIVSAASAAAAYISGGPPTVSDETEYDKVTVKKYNDKVVVGPYKVNFTESSFFKITGQNIVYNGVEKPVGIAQVTEGNIIEGGSISPGKEFHIIYDPHDGDNLIPYATLKIDYTYLAGFKNKKCIEYDGKIVTVNYADGQIEDIVYSGECSGECSLPHHTDPENGKDYHYMTVYYLYEVIKNHKDAQPLFYVHAEEDWQSGSVEFNPPEPKKEFDLSLKKFISKVDGVDTNRVPQEGVSGLSNKISQNAVYSKIYTPYRILSNVKEFTYTIRIYNEGDIAGRATKIQDHLPEGLSIVSVECNGYTWNEETWNKEDKRIITFDEIKEGDSKNKDIPDFDGTLRYTDIMITCKIDESAYDDMEDEQKVYDLSMKQYIKEITREGETEPVEKGPEDTDKERKAVQTDDIVTYTLKVTNEGEEAVYLKEIKQTLPKGLEFADDVNTWNIVPNSDGTTECSKIICENIEVEGIREYSIKCKVTATGGTLKTVSKIVSTEKPDIDWKKDWTDFAKVTVGATPEAFVDLKLEQVIDEVNGSTKEILEKGDVVKYSIIVTNEGGEPASNIKVADYIPDGMEFIPLITDSEYEELKQIADNELQKDDVQEQNQKWEYDENKKAFIYNGTINVDTPIYLYCVVTIDEEVDLKNIAEIISFDGGTDIDSTPDNVNYAEYLYEKQEDDDAFTIVSIKDSSNVSDLKITTEGIADGVRNTGDTIEYTITVQNIGSKDATVTIKDILEGMEYTGTTDTTVTYDKASKIITFKDIEIAAGQTKAIDVQCKVTAEKTVIELVNSADEASEIAEYNKEIKHTAYIEKADIYDKTKSDWQVEAEVGIVEAEVEEFEEQEIRRVENYEKYLTNKAMIIETSETDRDTSDWKDSETIIIDVEGKPTELKVIKKWNHGDNQKESWPDSVEVILYADGEECDRVTLNKDNNWEHIFKELERSKTYTIGEVEVSGYTTEITKNGNVYTIENTYPGEPREITVTKIWKDDDNKYGLRPSSITVKLIDDNGNVYKTTELNESNNWQHTFKNLPEGVNYTVDEENVAYYSKDINGYTITNTYGKKTKEITVIKDWAHGDNPKENWPNSVDVVLYEDGAEYDRVTLNEGNNWKHIFKNLDTSKTYTISEVTVPGYTTKIVQNGNVYNIENTYIKDPPGDDPDPGTDPILPVGIPITMEIAGNVFEDLPSTKAGAGDNELGVEDGMLAGIEVTLYECTEDGEIIGLAKLYEQHEENPNISEADSEIRTNPTITDEYGNYSFKGLDPTKKYKVKFKYNGLVYEAIDCKDQVEYNGEDWSVTSKAVENSDDRININTKFAEISASPNNYENGKVFLQTDLENNRIYDGQNIYELITNKIREKIVEDKEYPNIEDIYEDIIGTYSPKPDSANVGKDPDIAAKIQFIEDCKIEAETNRVYPVYDEFVIDSSAVQLKIGEKDTITPQTKYVGPKEGVNNYTGEYKQICNILKDVVDEVKASDEKFNIEYNLESDFVIDEETVQEDGIVGSFNVPIYIQELVKNDSTNEYEIQLKEDGVNAGVDAIKDKLAVSLTEKIETDFNYVAPEGEEDSEPISIQKQLIYDKFENHKDRIQDIVDDIIDKATLYYNNNFEILSIGSIDKNVPSIYPGQKQIHLGLVKREEFDLTIAKDVYQIDLSINGQNITYNYNNVDIDAYTGDWVAEVRANSTFYERNIYASDYHYHNWLTSKGQDENNKLELFVTYRIALRNQKAGIIGEITEIVDYYDEDYTFESIHISDGKNSEEGKIACTWENVSKYSNYEYKEHNDLNVGFITLGNEGLIESEKDKFIYIKFKVNEDAEGIIVDGRITPEGIKEYADSKQNIVEINGYKTYYKGNTNAYNGQNKSNMTPAGVLDKDSIPGNYVPSENYDSNKKQYYADEDDVGVANGLYILVDYYNQRTIEGTVWEDEAIETLLSQNIRQGDGTFTDNEKPIQNVKATLMNCNENNVKYEDGSIVQYYDIDLDAWVNLAVHTNKDGKYSLKGFVPGVYDVWFTYDNNSINRELDGEAYNETRYNGQDYKATIYEEKTNEDKWYIDESNRMSDAKDVWKRREEVNDYSKTLTNDIAESLVPSDLNKYSVEKTTMYARTDQIQIDIEYNKKEEVQSISYTYKTINESTNEEENKLKEKDDYGKYVIDNVDFGLVERPRAQLKVQNNVANAKLILADGTVLFDAIPTEDGKFEYTNLASIPRRLATAYVETKEKTEIVDGISQTLTNLKNSTHVSTEQGRITMNMDEELMQGANLQVTYEISVENIGELDYNNQDFYENGIELYNDEGTPKFEIVYNADGTVNKEETDKKIIEFIENYKEANKTNLVTTKAEQIIDYVEDNMQFSNALNNKLINKNWEAEILENIVAWDKEKTSYVNYKGDMFTRDVEKTNDYTIVRKDVLEKIFYKDSEPENDTERNDTTDDAYNTIAVLNSKETDTYDGTGNYSGNTATEPLKPDETAKSDFILTQLISPENENDDLTYKNVLELVKSSNDVGRRMYFSIAGNHVPVKRDEDPTSATYGDILGTSLRPAGREIDTDDGELITIIPPFGANMIQKSQYAILAIALVAVFGVGVYLIKKKVLK